MTRSNRLRAAVVGVAALAVSAGGFAFWRNAAAFHPSDVAVLGATGRPQLVEFFGRA
jgi:hypothetical protein